MMTTLQRISALAIEVNGTQFTDEQRSSTWLGHAPASNSDIASAENRLGIDLPDDYRQFLLMTNGFFTPNDSTEPTFEPIEKIDHLKNIDPFLIEVWNEGVLVDIGKQLQNAIVVGGLEDEQYFFLIPPIGPNSVWKYWKFANWIPGQQEYKSLQDYFTHVLDLMESIADKEAIKPISGAVTTPTTG